MPHEVIMPALGMAQETGLLVRWLKSPGDAVAVGDLLFETADMVCRLVWGLFCHDAHPFCAL